MSPSLRASAAACRRRRVLRIGRVPRKALRWDAFLLTWRGEEGRFRLEDEIPEGLLGGRAAPSGLYRPRALVLPGPPDPRASRYLHGDIGLAKLLP